MALTEEQLEQSQAQLIAKAGQKWVAIWARMTPEERAQWRAENDKWARERDEQHEKESQKRKRKSESDDPVVVDGEQEKAPPQEKGQTPPIIDPTVTEDDGPSPKRGRGRPKGSKNRPKSEANPPQQQPSPSSEPAHALLVAQSQPQAPENNFPQTQHPTNITEGGGPPPKRGPGRPKRSKNRPKPKIDSARQQPTPSPEPAHAPLVAPDQGWQQQPPPPPPQGSTTCVAQGSMKVFSANEASYPAYGMMHPQEEEWPAFAPNQAQSQSEPMMLVSEEEEHEVQNPPVIIDITNEDEEPPVIIDLLNEDEEEDLIEEFSEAAEYSEEEQWTTEDSVKFCYGMAPIVGYNPCLPGWQRPASLDEVYSFPRDIHPFYMIPK